jgi:hypothetical protein
MSQAKVDIFWRGTAAYNEGDPLLLVAQMGVQSRGSTGKEHR